MDEITKNVAKLYDAVPFVSKEKNFEVVFKSLDDDFKKWLKNKIVCEIGCGGGHITNYISNFCKSIEGFDISAKSLAFANKKNKSFNCKFAKGNIMDDNFVFKHKNKFDWVLAYGMLHHTSDPNKAFNNLLSLVKPNGYLTVGVYNSYGCFQYRIKRFLVNLMSSIFRKSKIETAKSLFFKSKKITPELLVSLSDGYEHPQVLFFTAKKLIKLFKKTNMELIYSYPPLEISTYPFILKSALKHTQIDIREINKRRVHNSFLFNDFTRWLVQLIWTLNNHRFGLFTISARKFK